MNRCPYCGNMAQVRKTPLGYWGECSVKGHIHNIGCFIYGSLEFGETYGNLAFSETENEAIKLWDEETNRIKQRF